LKILGISALYHDSAAVLYVDGELISAAQEERFTRIKHDERFPVNAINFCFEKVSFSIKDIDAIAFYDKPLLKFERILETHLFSVPKGLVSFVTSMPIWMKEKMFFKKHLKTELKKVGLINWKKTELLFPEHHLSHGASAYYPSGFEDAAIVTIDGVGEWATTSISKGTGNQITMLKEIHFPHSLGLLYSAFTSFFRF
jgi:carbamoyltransferase